MFFEGMDGAFSLRIRAFVLAGFATTTTCRQGQQRALSRLLCSSLLWSCAFPGCEEAFGMKGCSKQGISIDMTLGMLQRRQNNTGSSRDALDVHPATL